MFVKPLMKYNKTTKQRYNVYQLCESFRLDGRIRHRVIVGLGKLDELDSDEEIKQLGKRIEDLLRWQGHVLTFEKSNETIENLAHYFIGQIKKKGRYDFGTGHQDWQMVDLSTLKNKDGRELGAEWLCKQTFKQLGIPNFLEHKGWIHNQVSLAATHIISRAVYPASELKTVSFIKENSAICEITGFDKYLLT